MLFIHPMWDHESQRIGMQKCYPLAYDIHAIGELIGFLGLLALLGTLGWMAYLRTIGGFAVQSWWLLTVPFGIGIVSEALVQASWAMVTKRGFKYDYGKNEASWDHDGERVVYRYAQQAGPPDASGAGGDAEAEQSAQDEASRTAEYLKQLELRIKVHFPSLAGCLLGTAVGDALGLPYEGLSPRRRARLFPKMDRYHLLPFGRGMCSDDTEHTIMVAKALIETAQFGKVNRDAEYFRSQLASGMRFWLLGLPAGIGMATLKSILKLWLFLPQRWLGTFSAGNAPSMRSALIGVFWSDEPELLRMHVRASTRLTHKDPKAEHAALAVAVAASLSAQSARRIDSLEYAQQLRSFLGAEGAELAALIDKVAKSVQAGETTLTFAKGMGLESGVTGYAFHTVPVALHAWLAHPGNYREAVLAAIECGGDTDTVAAITGAIVGAGTGLDGLPTEMVA